MGTHTNGGGVRELGHSVGDGMETVQMNLVSKESSEDSKGGPGLVHAEKIAQVAINRKKIRHMLKAH